MKTIISLSKGRISRAEFKIAMGSIYVIFSALSFFLVSLMGGDTAFFTMYYMLFSLMSFVPKLFCAVKRSHDFGEAGRKVTAFLTTQNILVACVLLLKSAQIDSITLHVLTNIMLGISVLLSLVELPVFYLMWKQEGDFLANKYGDVPEIEKGKKKYIINDDGSVTFRSRDI